jgi:CHU_C Type IX secretion signal domain
MPIYFLFLIALFWGNFSGLRAQTLTEPCARLLAGLGGDSVLWSAQPCANFDAFLVYGRAGTTGSFNLLTTITNPNQRGLVHSNPTETAWEYRIEMRCAGAIVATTAVISNQKPVTPNLRGVNIINGRAVVGWDASPSASVVGYQVYKERPYGSNNFFPYPNNTQIITGNQFTDTDTTDLLVRYAIIAVSPCVRSLLGLGGVDGTTGAHTSIRLTGSLDSCAQTIRLSWNAYQNWAEGVLKYEIWLSQNGQAPQLVDTVAANVLAYTFQNAQDGDALSFFVRAIEKNRGGNGANSTPYRLNVSANQPMDYIYLTNLSLNPQNEPEIIWAWDAATDLQTAGVYRNQTNVRALTAPLLTNNTYTDPTSAAGKQSETYQLKSLDACGFEKVSNIGKTLFVAGKAGANFTNNLSWKPFDLAGATVQGYEIHRIVAGTSQLLARVDTSQDAYNDHINIQSPEEYKACYYLVANSMFRYPNGQEEAIRTRSNTVCVLQNAVMHLPNAFAPDGANRFFKPLIVFPNSISNYNMSIWDRYGKKLFETQHPFEGWDGGDFAQGVYVYQIEFTQPNGDKAQQQGTVVLIR